ncbi:STAS/SEC14 domain-containing protein [Martelella limonii]|uniref:STAS/SEC14 domain-containing protein n=1 Tax=Martelella limonii TaxID=1647649 RepID=UPI001580034C|nr:STAS/SEC14 domain-containing protein [Martelella limonii]
MLEKIDNLPDTMIGFTIHSALSANDYQNVLLPALETQSTHAGGLRLLLVTGPDFAGADVGSAMGGQAFRRSEPLNFKSIAIVSANRGFAQAVQMFGMLFHAEVRVFAPDRQDEAVAWLSA